MREKKNAFVNKRMNNLISECAYSYSLYGSNIKNFQLYIFIQQLANFFNHFIKFK